MRRGELSIVIFCLLIVSDVLSQDITKFYQHNFQTNTIHAYFNTNSFGNSMVYWGTDKNNLENLVVYNSDDIHHEIGITGLSPATPYYIKFASRNTLTITDTIYSDVIVMMTKSQSSGDIKAYFNSPVDHSVSSSSANNAVFLNNAFDDTIKAYLDRAQETIEMTMYNIDNDNGLISAINDAYARGVNVRIVGDKDINATRWNSINVGNNKVKSPDGSTPSGGFYTLMHNKFIIIDAESNDPNRSVVITGSTNFTSDQLLEDPNNLIIFQDQSLARGYKIEFEEMYGGTFGTEKSEPTPRFFEVGDSKVELFFSPKSGMEDFVIDNIYQTAYDFHFGVFSYTRWSVSNAIEDVLNTTSRFASGILEQVNTTQSEYTTLSGVMNNTLFVANQPTLFHHKYMILDPNCALADPRVWTGSANFSNNGFNNSDENAVLVHNADIANQYYQEYLQRYKDNGGTVFVQGQCDPIVLGITEDENIEEEMKISIYPNPSKGKFLIKSNLEYPVELDIYDMKGRKVLSQEALSPFQITELNLVEKGAYQLLFSEPSKGFWTTKRVVVK